MKKLFSFLAVASSFALSVFSQTIDLGRIVTIVDSPEKVEKTFTSEEIKNSAVSSLPELLRQKGLLVMSSGGSGTASNFSYKGYSGFCCKVYVDGVLATQPSSGEFDWNSIDINSIESITISEIPDTSTDQFAGCVVYITTRLVSNRGFELKTLAASYENSLADTVSLFGEYRDVMGNTGIKINGQVQKADNNYETPDTEYRKGETLKNNWSKMANGSFSFNTLSSSNLTFSGTSKIFYNKTKAFGTGSTRKYGIEDDLNLLNTVQARYVQGASVYSANLTAQFNQIDYDATVRLHEKTQMHQTDFLLKAENVYGFEASSVFSLENKITGTKKNRFHNTTKVCWNSRCISAGSSDLSVSDWISVIPSLGALFSNNGDFEFLPQLTVSSRLTGLSVSAFRQFVLPTFNQLYWEGSGAAGNTNLTPEEGWALVSSWKSPFTVFPVSVTYTYAKYGNKIRWTTENGLLLPMNTSEATYKTLEIQFSKNWQYVDLYGAVTNTQALLENKNQIMWVPEWQWNAGVNGHLGPVDAGVSVNFTGRRPKQNDNKDWYKEYLDLGAGFNWHWTNNLTFIIWGKNLLDQRRFYHDSYPCPSRTITCGIRITGPSGE